MFEAIYGKYNSPSAVCLEGVNEDAENTDPNSEDVIADDDVELTEVEMLTPSVSRNETHEEVLSSEVEELEVLSREVHSSKFQQQSNFETKVRLEGVNEDAEIISDPNSGEKYFVTKCCLEQEEDPNSEEYPNAHGGGSRTVNSISELKSRNESAGVHIDKYESAGVSKHKYGSTDVRIN